MSAEKEIKNSKDFSLIKNTRPTLIDVDKEIQLLEETIQLIRQGMRSEDPKHYGLPVGNNMDILEWGKLQKAIKDNAPLTLAIGKLKEKLEEIRKEFSR